MPSSVDAVVQTLEQSPSAARIKKLVYAASQGTWPSSTVVLEEQHLSPLVEKLLVNFPTQQDLRMELTAIVETLNKKVEYRPIGDWVFGELSLLYSAKTTSEQRVTQVQPFEVDNPPALPEPKPELSHTAQPEQNPPHWLDIRINIIKYANPLKVKILLFSLLYQPFSFSPSDWASLKACGLEHLLQRCFAECKTTSILEERLARAAQSLTPQEEYVQVASIVLRELRSLYPELPPAEPPMVSNLPDTGPSFTDQDWDFDPWEDSGMNSQITCSFT
jgi:hypothetical protein